MSSLSRVRTIVEIETLHGLLPELDYYRVLLLDQDCSQDAVGEAFRGESRRLHPDRMAAMRDDDTADRANDIFRLVNEAYRVLKDPEQRVRYDKLLTDGVLRMTDDAKAGAQADKRAGDPDQAATNPVAEKYWKMALQDFKNKSYKASVLNIQFAIGYEPDNEVFKEWLTKAKEALAESGQDKVKNPYKLRIM